MYQLDPQPIPENTNLLDQVPHPFLFVFVFLVLFQLHHTSERVAVILIGFVVTLIQTLTDTPLPTFPETIVSLRAWIGFDRLTQGLRMHSACPKCHSIYPVPGPATCTQTVGRATCNTRLLKTTPSGRLSQTPAKQYAYLPLEESLQRLFRRQGFEEMIGKWRDHQYRAETVTDVYDGMRWRTLLDNNDRPFVDDPRSLMLTLNVDWFAPFDGTYSVGAIYLVVNNLPRSERYKTENVILVGVMPGPKEPHTYEMNHYLQPLVSDFLRFYNGVSMATHQCPNGTTVRAALFNVACDIPASRKVSGFTSHNSTRACNKCTREFVVFPGTSNLDYSGSTLGDQRTKESNAVAAQEWRQAETDAARHRHERENGTRWSEVHRLPYFDPVHDTVIDPMHNLFLGTAKRMVDIWTNCGFLTNATRTTMQKLADGVVAPPGFPSLARKIERKFGFMTADDWKAWCLVYSPFVLKDVLAHRYYVHWMLFVSACRLLAKTVITYDEIDEAHRLLERFVRGCARLYQRQSITPNMHLHLHLRRVLQDFGPIYGFWLFSFERYNGYMKDAETNRKDAFELTFVKRFVEKTYAADFVRHDLAPRFLQRQLEYGFLLRIAGQSPQSSSTQSNAPAFDPILFADYSDNVDDAPSGSQALPPDTYASMLSGRPGRIQDGPYSFLVQHYRRYYEGIVPITEAAPGSHVCRQEIEKFRTIEIYGQTYRSATARSLRGSHIQALFRAQANVVAWTGQVQYYFTHVLVMDNVPIKHFFAYVRWYRTAGNTQRFQHAGLEEWVSHFMTDGPDCILPVHRIQSQVAIVAYGPQQDPSRSRIVVIPLVRKNAA